MRIPSATRAAVLFGALASAAPLALAQAPAARAGALAAKPAITYADFAAVRGVGDPQLSPDGKQLLYTVRTADVEANRRAAATYLLPVAGGTPRPFPSASASVTEARWSPDGTRVAYVAGGQLWIADADGANARQLTQLTGGASGPVWAPTGDRVAFVSAVYPDCADEACNARRDSARAASKVKAHVADDLLYRHWTAWDDGTRSHLFVVGADGSGLRDLTAGARYEVPPGPFGGSEGYAFAPDGREVAYTAKDQGAANAYSTDVNLYLVPVAGGAPVVITAANRGADQNPVYSPDGRFIAYASQAQPGFESDRWRLMIYDRAARQPRELLPSWDRNADGYAFADARTLIVSTTDRGRDKLYRVALDKGGNAARAPELVTGEHNNVAPSVARDGRTIAWLRDAAERPAEVWIATLGKRGAERARQLTHENDSLVARLALNPVEDYWFVGAKGDSVQGFVVRPPHWQPGQKYPTILLVHGGPQGAWLDQWHSRWNYQLFAAPGYGLVIVNPRGSTGYGQRFVNEVSKDWGGAPYEDLMKGLDAAIARYPWIDSTRLAAAGGSYGGYMVNWIAGHTNRFKALVSHAGPYNLENMDAATEELWFPEWEYGGPYWQKSAMETQYRVFSPHLFAQNFKTPTLVMNGELDFRVPYTEGLSMFTALRRQGVPARLVVFPDEGHFIAKPQNQRLWYGEIWQWLDRYIGSGPAAAATP